MPDKPPPPQQEGVVSHPCEQAETINKQSIMLSQQSASITRIEEHTKEFRNTQDRMAEVLVEIAKQGERFVATNEAIKKIEKDTGNLFKLFREQERNFNNHLSPTNVQSKNGFNKNQFAIFTGAATGFLTFVYTLVNKMLDYILSGGASTP